MEALKIAAALCLAAAAISPIEAQGGGQVYRDPSKPMEARIADLISQMTLEEKAAQLNPLTSRNDRLYIPEWGGWNQSVYGVWSKEKPTTLFPTAIGMSATWDPALIKVLDILKHYFYSQISQTRTMLEQIQTEQEASKK